MPAADPTAPATWCARALAAAALGALLLAALALRWTPPADVADLQPWPDALEYEEAARSLYAGRGYLLWIGDEAYPPRYPPGLSLLIAATMPLAGSGAGAGIWVVVASGVAAVAGAYAVGRMAGGRACGLVAALLVASSPLHVQWSRAVMSDVPASAAVVWLAAWALRLLRARSGALAWLLLGVACGLAGTIRYAVWALVPAIGVVVAALGDGAVRERARPLAALVAGAALGVLPLLWLNAELFGSAWRDGYAYWVGGDLMDARRALAARPSGAPSNLRFYGALLLGGGALYPWPAAVLLALGSTVPWWPRRAGAAPASLVRALVVVAWLVLASLVLLHLGFLWQWDRFLLPALPLVAAVMALPCARGAPPALRRAGVPLVAATVLLIALRPDRFAPPSEPEDVPALARIATIAEPDAAVLARSNAFAFARTLRADGAARVWVPLLPDPHRAAIARLGLAPVARAPHGTGWLRDPLRLPLTARRVVEVIDGLCREGRAIYLSERLDPRVLRQLERVLAARFTLTEALPAAPHAVRRIACAPPPPGPASGG